MKTILPPAWNVPEAFKARLGEDAGRQRAMSADGHLLLVLHEPPEPGLAERRGRLFWRAPDGEWKSNSLGNGVQALKKHLAEYSARLEELDPQLQSAETAAQFFGISQALAPLHRACGNLRAALQDARELVPGDKDLIVCRDRAENLERTTDLLHSDAKNGLDFTIARRSEEQAQRGHEMALAAHRLNLLAAIFFPIATLSAIFGMNLEHGLQIGNTPWAFWAVLLVGFVSGLLLTMVIS
ncbi:MAG TPA: CorA family divalent cation transporter, partial [Pirellulales bacterium]|nr:CorA family divalent cation transporter [Pirellulales bacterium]